MVSSLLMPAVTTGDVRLVHMIAERGGRANLVDDQGRSALWLACEHETDNGALIAHLLLDMGAEAQPSEEARAEGRVRLYPMGVACLGGRAELVGLLLLHRASPDVAGAVQWTPLTAALRSGSFETVQLLVQHGASIRKLGGRLASAPADGEEGEQITALDVARETPGIEEARLFIEEQDDQVDAFRRLLDDEDRMVAGLERWVEKVGGDADRRIEINMRSAGWETLSPLCAAVILTKTTAVSALLRLNADPNYLSAHMGRTPLALAVQRFISSHAEDGGRDDAGIIELLLDARADIDLGCAFLQGKSPMEMALQRYQDSGKRGADAAACAALLEIVETSNHRFRQRALQEWRRALRPTSR